MYFNFKLCFVNHINSTYGLIYRNCRDFTNRSTLKILIESLMGVYESIIWYLIYYILFTSVVLRQYNEDIFRSKILISSDLETSIIIFFSVIIILLLETRREVVILKFLHGLLHNKLSICFVYVQCPNSRSVRVFYHPSCCINLLKKDPITLMSNIVNVIYGKCDVLYDSLENY